MKLLFKSIITITVVFLGLLSGCTTSKTYNPILNNREAIDLSCKDCNVIFLNIDLLRADYVSLIRSEHNLTPNIDAFFKNSIIFEDVSSSSGVTGISNMATLLGLDGAFTHALLRETYVDVPPQLPFKYFELFSQLPSIAEALKANQYETININHGWYAGKQMLLHRGFDRYLGIGEVGMAENIPAKALSKATEILQEKAQEQNKFFLLMRSEDLRSLPYRYPLNRSHIIDPRIHYKRIKPHYYDIHYQTTPDGQLTVKFPSSAKINWMSNSTIEEYRNLSQALYAQQLTFIDEELGKLFSVIQESALLDKTIVVLYANHGDGLYDNRVPNHGVSYQSCVSVPLLIRHPKIHTPLRVRTPVSLIDLVPTIYGMVNVDPPKGVDGLNLNETIKKGTYARTYMYGADKESQYVRVGMMKLIVWVDRTKELYNLATDPHEQNNLVYQQPDLVKSLYSIMGNHEIERLDRALIFLKNK